MQINQQNGNARRMASLLPSTASPDMQKKSEPLKKIPLTGERTADRSELAARVSRAIDSGAFLRSQSVPVAPAQRREVSPTLLRLELQPLSAYDDNPVPERSRRRLSQEMAAAETGPGLHPIWKKWSCPL